MFRRLIRRLFPFRVVYLDSLPSGYCLGYEAGLNDGYDEGWQVGYDAAVESVGDWLKPDERE